MKKSGITTFVVEGAGEFPFDMLRFDACWPDGSNDAAGIANSSLDDNSRRGRRRVRLNSAATPTPARWDSFNWRVVETDGVS